MSIDKTEREIKKICYRLILAIVVLYSTPNLHAAGDLKIAGARLIGMGMSSICMVNVYSAYNNQAASAYLERPSFGLYYAPVFIGQGVSNLTGIFAMPVKKGGTIGVSVNYFGYSLYNEKKVGLSYAIKLAKWMSLGVQLDYLNTKISGYGSKNYVTFEMGLFSKPIDEYPSLFTSIIR